MWIHKSQIKGGSKHSISFIGILVKLTPDLPKNKLINLSIVEIKEIQ